MCDAVVPGPRELLPDELRILELDRARIHCVDEGAGETVLLLHGNPAWSSLYRKIIAGLRDEFRCVALDFPGYGMSSAPPGYRFTPRWGGPRQLIAASDCLKEVKAGLPKLADRLRVVASRTKLVRGQAILVAVSIRRRGGSRRAWGNGRGPRLPASRGRLGRAR